VHWNFTSALNLQLIQVCKLQVKENYILKLSSHSSDGYTTGILKGQPNIVNSDGIKSNVI
jgi:hypothetical protein